MSIKCALYTCYYCPHWMRINMMRIECGSIQSINIGSHNAHCLWVHVLLSSKEDVYMYFAYRKYFVPTNSIRTQARASASFLLAILLWYIRYEDQSKAKTNSTSTGIMATKHGMTSTSYSRGEKYDIHVKIDNVLASVDRAKYTFNMDCRMLVNSVCNVH